MKEAYICDYIRTPIGTYGGSLSSVRADDLGALPIAHLIKNNPSIDFSSVDDVIMGCANQAGEDNRNIARMSSLLAGLPVNVSGTTINRLCGSGMDAVSVAARAIKAGEAHLMIAGGVESMSRAPFVMPKATTAFTRDNSVYDTTIGWRFVNPLMQANFGVDSMPETAENVASEFNISRADQDKFAYGSQQKNRLAKERGFFDAEIMPVTIKRKKQDDLIVSEDEHPKPNTTLEVLAKLRTPFRENGSVTAGNASGVNDGAGAIIIASKEALKKYNLTPKAKIIQTKTVGVDPRIMGIGPLHAGQELLKDLNMSFTQMDTIELNEAFASQALATTRGWGLDNDDERINPNGGAISIGHPLGMSGARLIMTSINQLNRVNGRYALCAMCIGVGQGIAVVVERL